MRGVVLLTALLLGLVLPLAAQKNRRISEDRDFVPIDLSKWECAGELEGSAKTADARARNRGKNRPWFDASRVRVQHYDSASFLKMVSAFDAQTRGMRRSDLNHAQAAQLAALEKQIVSVTGYLVLAYAGPPESTNCNSVDFHDWHLEVFAQPQDHPPQVGDATPIIVESAPRTQNQLYDAGVRLRDLAAFMRRPDMKIEPTGQPARLVRFTGYLLWDDDHNGEADIGPRILKKAPNGYHQPWRSTPWEVHPVVKMEVLDSPPPAAAPSAPPAPSEPPPMLEPLPNETARSSTPPAAEVTASPAAAATVAVVVRPVKAKIAYGETVIPAGTRLRIISRGGPNLLVDYLNQQVWVPAAATDQK